MDFCVQVCNPVFLYSPGETASDLSEAIQTIFPMNTEKAIIVWNNTYIPICYKYDISVIVDDLLPMFSNLLERDKGYHQTSFGSNTFNAKWNLSWSNGNLSILANWNSVTGNLDDLLSSNCSKLETTVNGFLGEWKELLRRISTSIDKSEISIIDSDNYELMINIENSIKMCGYLYQ